MRRRLPIVVAGEPNGGGNTTLATTKFSVHGGDRLGGAFGSKPTLQDCYPNWLRVEQLHRNGPRADPLGEAFDYKAALEAIDLQALKAEIKQFLQTSVS